jgi:tRNA (guanine-N(7)-)-methyltransferase subunit TRM82
MEPPYHLLVTIGDHLFAAKGGDLHSFNLRDGSFQCSWQHSSKGKLQSGNLEAASEESSLLKAAPQDRRVGGEATGEPRAVKRRRLSGDGIAETQAGDAGPLQAEEYSQSNGYSSNRQVGRPSKMAIQDRAFITSLIASLDSRHLVTATGLDKTLRVFTFDESGSLTLLSER